MDSNRIKRGKLTLFLGAAAGVGKTYAMLMSANQRKKMGTDVLIGWLEDESYPATKVLAEQADLLRLPLRTFSFRGFKEMDTQEIIRRRPGLVLIDQLEHINPPGALKPKRYLEVESILSQGIDVYTTLNIQHVESLNDMVAQIIGKKITATVPDTFLDLVDHIQVVDLPTEPFIQRVMDLVHEDRMREELRPYYREGNINALREMTFRYAAQRVDNQLERYMQAKHIAGPWPVSEKVMVCVSASPFSMQLIRMGRQMAAGMRSDWLAVYVQTPQGGPGSEEQQNQLARNLQLAEELGAEVVSISGNQIAEELLQLARLRNVKQLIIGKPSRSRITEWFRSSLVEQVIRQSWDIHIHVIPGKRKDAPAEKPHSFRSALSFKWKPYVGVTLFIALLTVVLHALGLSFDLVNIALLYLLPVLFSAIYWGLRPSIYAAGLGVLAFDFFFVPPIISFTVADLRYFISFIVYLMVAVLTASLAARLKQQLLFSKRREAQTASLYSLSRQLTAITDIEGLLRNISHHVGETLNTQVALYLPDGDDETELKVQSFGPTDWGRGDSERVIAKWVLGHGEIAGRGSNTLRETPGLYIPLRTEDRMYGVLAINLNKSDEAVSSETFRMLEALGGLAAIAIARLKLGEEARLAHLSAESERLRTALLDSVSHELRTPLATIIGAVTGLIEGEPLFTAEDRLDLLSTIREGALRMNRLVTNLLGMVKLESGMLRLQKKWCDIEDVIGVVLAQVRDFQQRRNIKVLLPGESSFFLGDDVLIEQVLVNIISNAIKYSPDYSEIVISVTQLENDLKITVADAGVGIAAWDRERIFDKFYRAEPTKNIPGTGLGLAICKGIIEAHSGTIAASPNKGKGTVITITIPNCKSQLPDQNTPEGDREQA